MPFVVTHEFQEEETLASKAQWFQSLSLEERMELLCEFTDLILETNPQILMAKNAQPITGRVCVI
ncbi:MAG: hypothetical protein HY774_13500 [Acidobacteria bacterium]|nr:hypothetical protein [Acidobacteriota bacterium]